MRITLSLDDDVLAAVRQRAQRERISLGEAVSRYMREALRADSQVPAAPTIFRSKYSVFPARDEVITMQHLRHLMGQEGI